MNREMLKRTVKPLVYPVSLFDAKADLRVEQSTEDDLISGLIAAATDFMDVPSGAINKALITQTWAVSVACPDRFGRVHLPVTPVQSIESITYFDSDDTEQTLNTADFYLFGNEEWAYIEVKDDATWPTVYSRLDAITVTFTAGFGDTPEDVPDTIRHAIRLMVVHWYENRSSVVLGTITAELPMAVQSLINMNRKGWVA